MFKTSVATRLFSFTVLVTLLLASFPTATAVAAEKTNNRGLEAKWAKLIATYKRQTANHDSAPRWVAQWLTDYPREKVAKKKEIRSDLAASNAAWAPVQALVMSHNGFDSNGHVVDRAAAQRSVTELSRAIQRYIRSVRTLKEFLQQYK